MKYTITNEQARKFILAFQGLLTNQRFIGKAGIIALVERVGCLQFDPLNVVGYNHQLVLQSRIPSFRAEMLHELLYEDRVLIDGWDKCMSIYQRKDWPAFTRLRASAKQRLLNKSEVNAIIPEVLTSFLTRGPLTSGDLEYKEVVDWSWAPTRLSRAVLESLYFSGDLIIHRKEGTRKVYDLVERHLSELIRHAPDPNPTDEAYWEWYVLRRIGAIGLLWNKPSDAWLGISGMKSKERTEAFSRLLEKGLIVGIKVAEILPVLYIRTEDIALLEETLSEDYTTQTRAFVLAPLDNMIWDRKLIKAIFDFEYKWEVYKPALERQFGYYVLPVMCGDQFVARFEPGFDKKTKVLTIKNWWWEPGIALTAPLYEALQVCFVEFIDFTGAQTVRLEEPLASSDLMDFLTKKPYRFQL